MPWGEISLTRRPSTSYELVIVPLRLSITTSSRSPLRLVLIVQVGDRGVDAAGGRRLGRLHG